MKYQLLLSILIPGVSTRLEIGSKLVEEFENQVGQYSLDTEVEILWLVDNFKMSLGVKRQKLIDLAQGKYVIFCDDDDKVTDNYVKEITTACRESPDVVTFQQHCIWNALVGVIEFGLGNENEAFPNPPPKLTKRPAWHVCAWKRDIAIQCKFPDVNWAEDTPWADQANKLAKTSVHIPQILQYYSHSDLTSEAMRRMQCGF